MLLRQMELFVRVVEVGSISQAAVCERLSVASVSQQIKALEKEVGVPLLNRSNRGIQMTSQGEIFYADAKSILSNITTALNRVRDTAKIPERLNIGGYGSVCNSLLPKIYMEMRLAYPMISVNVQLINHEELEKKLILSEIDLYFVYGQSQKNIKSPLLRYIPIYEDKLYLSVPRKSKLAQKETITYADLRNRKLLLIQRGFSSMHDEIRTHIERNEPEIAISNCTENWSENIFYIKSNECCYLIPGILEPQDDERILRRVDFAENIPIGVICRKACSTFITKQFVLLSRNAMENLARQYKACK